MRHFILATFVFFMSFSLAQAQMAPSLPPSTFPETGTFCGWFKLCSSVGITSDEASPSPQVLDVE